MLRNLPITLSAGSVSSSNSDIPSSMTGTNVHKRGCWWSALRLGNAQRVTLILHFSLHPLHECVATQIDLLAQSLPKAILPSSAQFHREYSVFVAHINLSPWAVPFGSTSDMDLSALSVNVADLQGLCFTQAQAHGIGRQQKYPVTKFSSGGDQVFYFRHSEYIGK